MVSRQERADWLPVGCWQHSAVRGRAPCLGFGEGDATWAYTTWVSTCRLPRPRLQETSLPQLLRGLAALRQQLSEHTGQLKSLVKENFDRFTSSKNTIDTVHAKLQKAEAEGEAGVHGSSTAEVLEAVQRVSGQGRLQRGACKLKLSRNILPWWLALARRARDFGFAVPCVVRLSLRREG